MRIKWVHRDKCPKCNQIIWTQEGDLPANLRCQCICGATFLENDKTISGGGAHLTEQDFRKAFNDAHSYLLEEIILSKK